MRPLAASFAFGMTLAAGAFGVVPIQEYSVGAAVAQGFSQSQAMENLRAGFPGVQFMRSGESIRCIYGVPMNEAATPDQAVAAFWSEHGATFGIAGLELQPLWSNDVNWQKFTVFAYRQLIDGLPVEYTLGRVLVLNGSPNRVVYAAGIFAQPPAGGFADDLVDGPAALQSVQAMLPYRQLTGWTQPEMVIYAGTESEMGGGQSAFGVPLRVWKFTGDNGDPANRVRRTFFVNAADGRLIAARNEIHHTDVGGTVQGKATPGTRPDVPSNVATIQNMPEIRVEITGGANAFADRNGAFNISNPGTATVTVNSSVVNGRWVSVNNTQAAGEITASQSVLPPGPAALMFNNTPSAPTTAQTNAFIHTTLVHNFIKDRASWTGVDTAIPANVNISSTCNAFYDGASINFFLAGGGCVNSAYSTVVAHEFGHHVVQQLGLSQGAFGEGFGDCLAILLYNDPVVARDFAGTGSHIRDYSPGIAEDPYPCAGSCGGEVHCCGEILGGMWWDIRERLGASMGEPAGLTYTQQLFIDWMQITAGGSGSNSAHPQTIIEILTMDDDDGVIANGTPNRDAICTATLVHNLPCPPLDLGQFVFPDGVPTLVPPNQPTNIRVDVVGIAATPTPGTGTLSYRIGGGTFTTVAMSETAANQYVATIPAQPCDARLNFYFSAQTSGGPISSPRNAPAEFNAAIAASEVLSLANDDFETDNGWARDAASTATVGRWERANPQGTAAQPGGDHSDPGTLCWITDSRGLITSAFDVDGGHERLISPAFDFAGASGATVEFWLWYSNDRGAAPGTDTFRVDASNDNGATWTNALTIGPSGPGTTGTWIQYSLSLAPVLPLTNTVRLRFVAEDAGVDSVVEAALDDVRIFRVNCAGGEPCNEDLDGDGTIGLQDLAVLLAHFGQGGATQADGDIDNDDDVDLQDLGFLLASFGTNCP